MRKRHGFTLVELLVVITIIGILMGLLTPAVNAVRESARTKECATKMRNLAVACLEYEATKKLLPGYDNKVGMKPDGTGAKHASWAVVILPYLERGDIFAKWANPTGGTPFVYLDIMICGSDPPETQTGAPMSYVANCGKPDSGGVDLPANGIFMNNFSGPVPMSSDLIADGTTVTAMISENVQANQWYSDTEVNTERLLGFVWHDAESVEHKINGNKNILPNIGTTIDHARPSSQHSGGVNVAFCHANTRFISDSMDYKVYQQMLTSNSALSSAPQATKDYLLDEKELQ